MALGARVEKWFGFHSWNSAFWEEEEKEEVNIVEFPGKLANLFYSSRRLSLALLHFFARREQKIARLKDYLTFDTWHQKNIPISDLPKRIACSISNYSL